MVTTAFFLKQELSAVEALLYFVAEFTGCIAGAFIAHAMFQQTVEYAAFEGKDRDSWGEFISEVVATFGLLTVILGSIAAKKEDQIPMAVGLYITAGYWFTSSTSFANPAVVVGRSFTTTFASINPKSFHVFFGGQLIGLAIALPFNAWLFQRYMLVDAFKVLMRQKPAVHLQTSAIVAKTQQLQTFGPQYNKNVLFLCNHNSCRSQMADGWMRHLRGTHSIGVQSAGIVGGTAVKEGAIIAMKEAGIDMSQFTSDAMADFKPEQFDVVISCCGCGSKLDGDKEAWKKRQVFEDWNLDDPPAIDPGDLSAYRRVRDETKAKVEELIASINLV
jgi:glutathione/glutaredoxin type arsenate reductase